MELKDKLKKTVEDNLDNLDKLKAGTVEYNDAVTAIGKLSDKILEFEKLENNKELEEARMELESEKIKADKELEESKIEQAKKSGRTSTWLTIGTFVVSCAMTIVGSHVAWKKEEKGYTPTDLVSKFHLNNLIKGKK